MRFWHWQPSSMHFYYAFLAIDFAFGTHGLVPGQQLKMLGLEACLVAFFAHPKDLKAFLMDIWGPHAMSLGTIAVERTWWLDHVRNMNRTARWATEAWRQHRAVVAWKHDVASVLRKAEEPLRKGRAGRNFIEAVEQTLVTLQDDRRSPWRLGCLSEKEERTNLARRPESGEFAWAAAFKLMPMEVLCCSRV